MKKYLVLLLLVITLSTSAQTIRLDYIPHGLILKFEFNNLTLYSDTSSLFSFYNDPSDNDIIRYEQRIRDLINRSTVNDTAKFIGSFIPFNDSLQDPEEIPWRVWLDLRVLTLTNKIVIIDSHGDRVNKIKIRRKGTIRKCYVRKVFINAKTKEELFVYRDIKFCSGLVFFY